MAKHKPKIRLYINKNLSHQDCVDISDAQNHYLQNVMRLSTGDVINIFDGISGEYEAKIKIINKKNITLDIEKKVKDIKVSPDIWLIFAPVKKEQTDFIIEKATELGVSRIIPITTEFSVVKKIKKERYEARVIEASEQCRRLDVPQVEDMISFRNLLKKWDEERVLFFMDESGEGNDAFSVFNNSDSNGKVAILIGPEGGFSSFEMLELRKNKYVKPVSLGNRILRAETAAISALSCWQAISGDWRKK